VSRLLVAVPAKINLHLQILGSRADGHHEIWTLFQSIDLTDELVVDDDPGGAVTLAVEPAGAAPGDRDNLVLKAASALCGRTGATRGAKILLRKRIPVGAGLGGGSADAAAALAALDAVWNLRLSPAALAELAGGLGADVSFFLHGGFALGRGRGEIVRPLPDLRPRGVVIAVPPIEVSTAVAFAAAAGRRLTSGEPDATVEAFVAGRREGGVGDPPWGDLGNDLEEVVVEKWPVIGQLVRAIRETGPLHAAVTGSGAAVFGIYADLPAARRAAQEIGSGWRVHVVSTLGRRQAGLLDRRSEQREEERSWK
jgi:4-diphosphocytidyl-2-C-methyl-D-erythritol kinase